MIIINFHGQGSIIKNASCNIGQRFNRISETAVYFNYSNIEITQRFFTFRHSVKFVMRQMMFNITVGEKQEIEINLNYLMVCVLNIFLGKLLNATQRHFNYSDSTGFTYKQCCQRITSEILFFVTTYSNSIRISDPGDDRLIPQLIDSFFSLTD